MTLVKHRRRSELRKGRLHLPNCMRGESELRSLKFFAKYTPEVINKMLSKLVTNEWINEKGMIPLQPSAKVINIFQGKRRAPAVTEGSKKGRRKGNGFSIANVVIYSQKQKCLWDQHAHLSSQRQTYRGSPIKMMRLLDEFRIQNQGRWLYTWNVPWPSASTAGCNCLPNRDSPVDGAFIFTSYWLISNLFKDCQETLINLTGVWSLGRGVWSWLYPPLTLSP